MAQVDFFEVTVEEAGHLCKAWKFLMRLMYSAYDYVWLYDRCDQLSFPDADGRAFTFFGGIPQRLAYDNLSAAERAHHRSRARTYPTIYGAGQSLPVRALFRSPR